MGIRAKILCARSALAVMLLWSSFGSLAAGEASVAQVWSLEEPYWRYVQSGGVERYLTLWHPKFIGWPCALGQAHPATKSSIGDWVRRIRDENARFTYELTREAAEEFGDVVVVYYRTPMRYEYPDGRVTGRDRSFKFVHTWKRVGSGWQIIGGMCASLDPAPG